MPTHTTVLSSFNNFPRQLCTLHRPKRYRELSAIVPNGIARGQGCSYGDAALNENGQVILTESLNRFVAFDHEKGILTAEAGVTLTAILALIIPRGWFLPVTPGTQYVSLGGCVAADVHGKNHHHMGSFGQYVLWFDLITANGATVRCSPQQNAELFWATLGGMGLTGIIATISVQLIPITSSYLLVKHQQTQNLMDTIDHLSNAEFDDQYSVAWLDTLATGEKFGRGILMAAHHATAAELTTRLNKNPLRYVSPKQLSIPFDCPNWLLNKTNVQLFNQAFYEHKSKKAIPFIVSYRNYFYPLDSIGQWNRLYGKQGFVQYQCVLPLEESRQGLQKILRYLQTSPYSAFLAVLKRFGAANPGMLSFPIPGFTLAIDLPITDPGLFSVLDKMDDLVIEHGGRIYLAKDARLDAAKFRVMYPRHAEWSAIRNQWDPQQMFSSSLARRLAI